MSKPISPWAIIPCAMPLLCKGRGLSTRYLARAVKPRPRSGSSDQHADGVHDGRGGFPEGTGRSSLACSSAFEYCQVCITERRTASCCHTCWSSTGNAQRTACAIWPWPWALKSGAERLPKPRRRVIARVRELLDEVDIPPRLSAFGVTREMIPALARKAMEDACHLSNPRPCTEADMVALYEKAL